MEPSTCWCSSTLGRSRRRFSTSMEDSTPAPLPAPLLVAALRFDPPESPPLLPDTSLEAWLRTRVKDVPGEAALAAAKLLAEGATVPFVARYRKDETSGLDEAALRRVAAAREVFERMEARRAAILDVAERQKKRTPELEERLQAATRPHHPRGPLPALPQEEGARGCRSRGRARAPRRVDLGHRARHGDARRRVRPSSSGPSPTGIPRRECGDAAAAIAGAKGLLVERLAEDGRPARPRAARGRGEGRRPRHRGPTRPRPGASTRRSSASRRRPPPCARAPRRIACSRCAAGPTKAICRSPVVPPEGDAAVMERLRGGLRGGRAHRPRGPGCGRPEGGRTGGPGEKRLARGGGRAAAEHSRRRRPHRHPSPGGDRAAALHGAAPGPATRAGGASHERRRGGGSRGRSRSIREGLPLHPGPGGKGRGGQGASGGPRPRGRGGGSRRGRRHRRARARSLRGRSIRSVVRGQGAGAERSRRRGLASHRGGPGRASRARCRDAQRGLPGPTPAGSPLRAPEGREPHPGRGTLPSRGLAAPPGPPTRPDPRDLPARHGRRRERRERLCPGGDLGTRRRAGQGHRPASRDERPLREPRCPARRGRPGRQGLRAGRGLPVRQGRRQSSRRYPRASRALPGPRGLRRPRGQVPCRSLRTRGGLAADRRRDAPGGSRPADPGRRGARARGARARPARDRSCPSATGPTCVGWRI